MKRNSAHTLAAKLRTEARSVIITRLKSKNPRSWYKPKGERSRKSPAEGFSGAFPAFLAVRRRQKRLGFAEARLCSRTKKPAYLRARLTERAKQNLPQFPLMFRIKCGKNNRFPRKTYPQKITYSRRKARRACPQFRQNSPLT